eukprot:28305_1
MDLIYPHGEVIRAISDLQMSGIAAKVDVVVFNVAKLKSVPKVQKWLTAIPTIQKLDAVNCSRRKENMVIFNGNALVQQLTCPLLYLVNDKKCYNYVIIAWDDDDGVVLFDPLTMAWYVMKNKKKKKNKISLYQMSSTEIFKLFTKTEESQKSGNANDDDSKKEQTEEKSACAPDNTPQKARVGFAHTETHHFKQRAYFTPDGATCRLYLGTPTTTVKDDIPPIEMESESDSDNQNKNQKKKKTVSQVSIKKRKSYIKKHISTAFCDCISKKECQMDSSGCTCKVQGLDCQFDCECDCAGELDAGINKDLISSFNEWYEIN